MKIYPRETGSGATRPRSGARVEAGVTVRSRLLREYFLNACALATVKQVVGDGVVRSFCREFLGGGPGETERGPA